MERHYGKRPIIYTTVDFYEANFSNGALTDYPIGAPPNTILP